MRPRSTLGIGLLGLGTVGSEVFARLQDDAMMTTRTGGPFEVARVAIRQRDRERRTSVPAHLLTADPMEVVESPRVDIVVEVMGGLEPARTLLLRALALGKPVVTANKQLLATHGAELFAAAETFGIDLRFEGSAGGGIPIMKPLRESLASARIHAITGILNGTTNYILTRMSQQGWTFDDALTTARQQGFAEADPTEDIDGSDAAAKLVRHEKHR